MSRNIEKLTAPEKEHFAAVCLMAMSNYGFYRDLFSVMNPYRLPEQSDYVETAILPDKDVRVGLTDSFFKMPMREAAGLLVHVASHYLTNYFNRAASFDSQVIVALGGDCEIQRVMLNSRQSFPGGIIGKETFGLSDFKSLEELVAALHSANINNLDDLIFNGYLPDLLGNPCGLCWSNSESDSLRKELKTLLAFPTASSNLLNNEDLKTFLDATSNEDMLEKLLSIMNAVSLPTEEDFAEAGISFTTRSSLNTAVDNTMEIMRQMGSGQANELISLVRNSNKSKINYLSLVSSVVSSAVTRHSRSRFRPSYSVTNKRPVNDGFLNPGYLGKSVKALLAVDSSASMKGDKKIFNQVATEINTFLQSTKLRPITVLGLDTNIESVSRVTALEGVELRGGGGTELSSVFDWIDKCKKRDLPDIMVLLTDGEYNWQEFIEKSKKYPSITKIVVIVNNVESVASYARITLGSVATVISAGKGI